MIGCRKCVSGVNTSTWMLHGTQWWAHIKVSSEEEQRSGTLWAVMPVTLCISYTSHLMPTEGCDIIISHFMMHENQFFSWYSPYITPDHNKTCINNGLLPYYISGLFACCILFGWLFVFWAVCFEKKRLELNCPENKWMRESHWLQLRYLQLFISYESFGRVNTRTTTQTNKSLKCYEVL